jgi:hypothetical protein
MEATMSKEKLHAIVVYLHQCGLHVDQIEHALLLIENYIVDVVDKGTAEAVKIIEKVLHDPTH